MDWQPDGTQIPLWTYPHCQEPAERPPPTTEPEVRTALPGTAQANSPTQHFCSSSFQLLLEFYRQQKQIRELREELKQKDVSDPPAEAPNPVGSGSVIDSFVVQMKISKLEKETRNNLTQPLNHLQDDVEHGNSPSTTFHTF